MDKKTRESEEILNRLSRVEGQIRGIQRMVVEERDCEAIVTQLMAARAALDKASLYVLNHHLARCLATPNGQTTQAQVARIVSFFMRFAGTLPEVAPAAAAEDLTKPDAHDIL